MSLHATNDHYPICHLQEHHDCVHIQIGDKLSVKIPSWEVYFWITAGKNTMIMSLKPGNTYLSKYFRYTLSIRSRAEYWGKVNVNSLSLSFFFFLAMSAAYGNSQARDQTHIHSSTSGHCSNITRSLIFWATEELQKCKLFFFFFFFFFVFIYLSMSPLL